MVHFISFHINRAEWSGRAEVLAGAAADAFVFVHGRHLHGAVLAFVVHHLDGSRGAVTCTVATRYTIGQYHAIVFNPYGMTYMDAGLLFPCDGFDGTGRADLATSRAFGATIAALKRHRGLHEAHQVSGGTQDVVRT